MLSNNELSEVWMSERYEPRSIKT